MFCPQETMRASEPLGSIDSLDSPNPLYQFDCPSETFNGMECGFGAHEERFRIDRKKLEDMLQVQQNGENGVVETAEEFFQRVMQETSTQISWPSKLKIGAKSKKDPHVKIVGKPEAVAAAKDMILAILDTKKNRVTLKMDVSHSDHSYVIGKGGFKIQQVMEETGCHIHFPDSNRNNSSEKSNQVSIAGQAEGVEQARCKIRDLLPMVFMFELPSTVSLHPGDETSPAVQHIQQTYSFNVAFRPLVYGNTTLMIVRGCHRHLPRLRQGLMILMEYLTGSKMTQILGYMKTEIAPQHHPFVMGPGGINIQTVMQKTGATITFPESAFARMPNAIAGHQILQSKSTVVIYGHFDSVCLAWQELLKCLPLMLMFELKEGQEVNTVLMNHLMEAFNISIMVRPKLKENTKSVLVRGGEKDSRLLFKVRRQILGLNKSEIPSCCERHSASQTPDVLLSAIPGPRDLPIPAEWQKENIPSGTYKEVKEMSNLIGEYLERLANLSSQYPQLFGILDTISALSPCHSQPALLSMLLNQASQVHNESSLNSQVSSTHLNDIISKINVAPTSWNFPNSKVADKDLAGSQSGWLSKSALDKCYAEKNLPYASMINHKITGSEIDGDSGIFSMHGSSRYSCDSSSDLSSQADTGSENDHKNILSRQFSQAQESRNDLSSLLTDYESKKITATKTMQQQVGDGVRTPTSLWSGYGFSKSMPDFVLKSRLSAQNGASVDMNEIMNRDYPIMAAAQSWSTANTCETAAAQASAIDTEGSPVEQGSSFFSLSNFWETLPQQSPALGYDSVKDLAQLFSLFDLEKYMDIFMHHEIDLPTFLTLTDFDLQQLNISYGARRKMLSAISALKRQRTNNELALASFRAAPGAERRALISRYTAKTLPEES